MTPETSPIAEGDSAPGGAASHSIGGYLLGLALAAGLTWLSFTVAAGTVVWSPGVPAALLALAVAQMGIHLVFFLHITSGPEHTNNVLALAFGILIVALLLAGSLWIMTHLNMMMANQMPMEGSF